jgi:hypothetical protein
VDAHVALEIGLDPVSTNGRGFHAPSAKQAYAGERDRDVEVEDPLREALVGVRRGGRRSMLSEVVTSTNDGDRERGQR